MSILQTVLVFATIPLSVIGLLYALVYGGSAARSKRYRPGRPFTSAPVWFLAEVDPEVPTTARALSGAATGADPIRHGEVGGASDSW